MTPRKTHCVNGHPRTTANIRPGGGCRTCANTARRNRDPAKRVPRATHCKRGHERTPDNVDPKNLDCIQCRRARQRTGEARELALPIPPERHEYNVRGWVHYIERRRARIQRQARIALVRRVA